jgi:hypothetical protein
MTPPATTVFSVVGTNPNGCTSTFTVVQLVDNCTGFPLRSAYSPEFNVYPNPTKGEFVIEAPENSEMLFLNSLGQNILLQQLKESKTPVSIAQLANGIYFIRIEMNDKQQVIKILKE